ncbi:hypothetical protein ACFOMD_17970 [Sphingoaurantiacus capsulatus]|uniref:Uncharacterized protein n=1 Tax=Sphingoaurantiacus capsulatus TaxID=1771310 RepID=A0ABV7XE62_9SPHN
MIEDDGSRSDQVDLGSLRSPILFEIIEDTGQFLTVELIETTGLGALERIDELIGDARPIRPQAGDRTVRLIWNYVAYFIVAESFYLFKPGAASSAVVEEVAGEEDFLSYVRSRTWNSDDHFGRLSHWKIQSSDHVVHIAARGAPEFHLVGVVEGTVGND